MRIQAAIRGDLHEVMKAESKLIGAAVREAVIESSTDLRDDLRGDVRKAGLGNRLANAWRMDIYPNNAPIETAGFIHSKAPKIMLAHEGGLIKSRDGFFLAIPTEAAPKRGVGGKRINPSNFPENSLGRLRFVYRAGKPSLLVVDGLRAGTGKRGGFRKASATAQRTGRGLATVVMFILVPQVRLKKKFDIARTQEKGVRRFFDKLSALLSQ